jgi:hypothetical protein
LKPRHLDTIATVVTLEELPQQFEQLLKGGHKGRTVVRL